VSNLAKPYLSVISPVYCCAACLVELSKRIGEALESITPHYEIIFINDSSPDNAWEIILKVGETDKRIKGIHLSRNFGQHYAITAGLEAASGEWVVVMDCDLQDRPEEIPALFKKAQEGFEVVFAERQQRQDHLLKRLSSRFFYHLLNYLSGSDYDFRTANFGVFHRKVIDAICSMGDQSRFFPTMVRWTGFRTTSIPVVHQARGKGKTSYSLSKLIKLGVDIILSCSDKPLRIAAGAGILISLIATAMVGFSLLRYLHGDVTVAGYTSIMASMWLLAGIILFSIGIIGLYLGRIFEAVKKRPAYIISKKSNFHE